MQTTRLSSKGQVILPKSVREAHRWRPGTEFVVEELPDGIVLRASKPFAPSRLEDVAGILHYRGKPKSLAQMDEAIRTEVKRRHAGGRY